MSSNQAPSHISVIIPVFNEAPTLKPLYNQIRDVMGLIGVPYEIIFVDDGSSDDSLGIMEEIYRLRQEWKWTPVESSLAVG